MMSSLKASSCVDFPRYTSSQFLRLPSLPTHVLFPTTSSRPSPLGFPACDGISSRTLTLLPPFPTRPHTVLFCEAYGRMEYVLHNVQSRTSLVLVLGNVCSNHPHTHTKPHN